MGGNAFDGHEGINISRLNPTDYQKVEKFVLDLITPYCIDVRIPFYIQDKKTFGDIDVLYVLDETKINADEFLVFFERELKSLAKIQLHPGSYSYHFNADITPKVEAQVDLMRFPDVKSLEFAHFFMSHSDFGNIAAHMCTCYGYTFTDTLLMIKVLYDNDPGRHLGNVKLTDEIVVVCEFLDYDYDTLCKPFQTEKELFEFMTSSSLFNPHFFGYEQMSMSNTHRKHAIHRQVYKRFMDFVQNKYINDLGKFPKAQDIDRAKFKESAAEKFGKVEEYNGMMVDYARRVSLKKKMNSDVVQEWIPVFVEKQREDRKNGKHLGDFMKHIRNIYSDDEILEMDHQVFEANVKNAFEEFRRSLNW